MAILRANTGGAWITASVWQVYDEDTNTWSAYGHEPRNNDIVYLNGKTITLSNNQTINIGNGTIRNDANTNIGVVAGGYLSGYSNTIGHTFTANFINASTYIFTVASSDATITIIGDVTSTAGVAFNRTGSSGGVYYNVTGNVTLNNGSALGQSSANFNTGTIIGNVTVNSSQILKGTSNRSLTITGNITCESGQSNVANSLVIVGNVIGIGVNACITIVNIDINGGITYKSSNPSYLGIKYTGNLVIQNPDTFTWKDVTEPRSNPFIILTNADMNNRQQYPPENEVKQGTEYIWGQKVGTYLPDYPPESVVLQGYIYDNGDKTGSMSAQAQVGCVTKEDVREGVALIGMGEVGTLVVPSVDDVREGVVFDNGSVGTLIVQGGGERLRIADFGYYTRSTSITYIVDLTESDKPAFADCEEIVLRSLFPTLDLDNIPDKFFDDLFIQFLRYRLLVEYYRGTSINSKFTPSEPTTEIVNYANTKCEYWLNTANLFLQLWGEKYPNSVKKDRILL